jgi:hypothetical protein
VVSEDQPQSSHNYFDSTTLLSPRVYTGLRSGREQFQFARRIFRRLFCAERQHFAKPLHSQLAEAQLEFACALPCPVNSVMIVQPTVPNVSAGSRPPDAAAPCSTNWSVIVQLTIWVSFSFITLTS